MYTSGIGGRNRYIAPQRPEGSKLISTNEAVLSLPAFIITALKEVPGSYLAGGALRAQYDNCGVKDYDFFFRNSETAAAFHQRFAGFQQENIGPDVTSIYAFGHTIQSIRIQYFDTLDAVVDYFDMVCNQFALEYAHAPKIEYPGPFAKHSPAPKGEWKYLNYGYRDAIDRKIHFHNPKQLNNTIARIETFRQRGYTIDQEEYEKLLKYIRTNNSFTATPCSAPWVEEPKGGDPLDAIERKLQSHLEDTIRTAVWKRISATNSSETELIISSIPKEILGKKVFGDSLI